MAGMVAVGFGFAVAKKDWLLSNLGGWLVQHRVLVDPAAGLVTIPYLGGLDVARLAVVVGVGVLAVVMVIMRRKRDDDNRQTR